MSKINKISIHETAVIEQGARIGNYTSVWHYTHVEKESVIGENCNLGQNVYIGQNSVIGNACRIGNSVSIFNNVELEDFVFCAPFMVFTHISYPRAAINRRGIFEKTLVKLGATLGANSTILPGITIGVGAFVAAGAILTKSCKSWALMVGMPARHVGWVSAVGERIPLPLKGTGKWKCPHTGDIYSLNDEYLSRISNEKKDILMYKYGEKLQRYKL